MRGSILGVERQRRWSEETKIAAVCSVGVDGATVTQAGERHELIRQQIYGWRRFYNTQRPHRSFGYKPPAPEVFLPANTAQAVAPP